MPSDRAPGANPGASFGANAGAARRPDAGYEVRISARHGVVTASVAALRASGALRVAEGRPVGEAAGLAGLLFPMNAAAQTAAALLAAEAALKVSLPPAQIAARELLVGFETAAACAWRMGLLWPQLSAGATSAGPVQDTRAAADAAAEAIFAESDWPRIGGGVVRPRLERLHELVAAVRTALGALAPALEAHIFHAPPIASLEGRDWPLLDEAGLGRAAESLAEDASFSARPHLAGKAIEESPRALLRLERADDGLPAWFRAQARFAEELPRRLDQALAALVASEPVLANAKGSGKGWGMAVTARGRILHWIAVERGKVAAWRALEPTDWNFAPRGPVARLAELLPPDSDLAEAGRWVAAAFDPSAPCRIVVEAEEA
jgi:coenzyme F420-reducing hydrogenase alpha subunit